MISKVIMPKLGQTMEEGTIARWVKKEGDKVEKGDILLEITTDKATLEVESYASGFLRKIVVQEEETVPVTEVIAYIADDMKEEIPEELKGEKPGVKKREEKEEGVREKAERPPLKPGEGETKVKISPLARKLAEERGVDIGKIKGSGPGGRIVKEDILKAGTKKEEPQGAVLRGMRKVIAERTARSKVIAAHYYITTEVDMSKLEEIHKSRRISYTALIIKAVASSLEKFPLLNASLEGEKIISHKEINIGVLVALEDGLIVPVVKGANKKPSQEIDKEVKDLAARARGNKLMAEEIAGSTFSISNLGIYDIESFTAIINQPESAILALGKKKEKPVAVKGEVVVCPMMKLTLSVDHRLIDGAVGAKFLGEVKRVIERREINGQKD
jgi:pyruvate dehydrogenase E2 component (dihydrolipoamide acetyltransferase)